MVEEGAVELLLVEGAAVLFPFAEVVDEATFPARERAAAVKMIGVDGTLILMD